MAQFEVDSPNVKYTKDYIESDYTYQTTKVIIYIYIRERERECYVYI